MAVRQQMHAPDKPRLARAAVGLIRPGMVVIVDAADADAAAAEAVDRTRGSVAQGLPIDFWTIDLRDAVVSLGEVTGDEVTEEVLDSIFSRFCIGK